MHKFTPKGDLLSAWLHLPCLVLAVSTGCCRCDGTVISQCSCVSVVGRAGECFCDGRQVGSECCPPSRAAGDRLPSAADAALRRATEHKDKLLQRDRSGYGESLSLAVPTAEHILTIVTFYGWRSPTTSHSESMCHISDRTPKSKSSFHHPNPTRSSFYRSFFPDTIRQWNLLPATISNIKSRTEFALQVWQSFGHRSHHL